MEQINNSPERAVLIGIAGAEEYIWAEFAELVAAAGAKTVARLAQPRETPDPALFFGKGKAVELVELVQRERADLVIALQELSPVQVRNLEQLTAARVIDRTDVILDLFAQRARSREGKLQVELAQLNYELPRLTQSRTPNLSRLGGGIGTRGPGETKLETDRRRVRNRITAIRRELAATKRQRQTQRQQREKGQVPTVALVGYTNAGKSTLFNYLTNAGVTVADQLFATLDPVARRLRLPQGTEIILLDTVGFVSDLPHQLVAAFRATLEETVRAALLLKLLDATSPCLPRQYAAIQQVLSELGILEKPSITVLNKADAVASQHDLARLAREWEALPVSALTGSGMTELLAELERRVNPPRRQGEFLFPFAQAGLVEELRRQGRILHQEYTAEGIAVRAELAEALFPRYQRFLISGGSDA